MSKFETAIYYFGIFMIGSIVGDIIWETYSVWIGREEIYGAGFWFYLMKALFLS